MNQDGKVTVKELIKQLYEDAVKKDLLNRKVGTVSSSTDKDGNSVLGLLIFKDDNCKEEQRVNGFYRDFR